MQVPNLTPAAFTRQRAVLLVDDHPVLREGLRKLINQEQDLRVCAEAKTPAEALAVMADLRPDVVVVDLLLTEGHGLELIKDIHSLAKDIPILVFSMLEEEAYALRALKAGARGYISKQEPSDQVIAGIRAVLRGDYAVGNIALRMAFGSGRPPGSAEADLPGCLGNRELEVFELLGQGFGTRQIAHRLGRSFKTIETYRARIKQKLQLKSAPELVREAVRWMETRS